MSDIYDQHRAAFAQVEAHVILKEGERVATVAFKFPRDGAGRLYGYVHWIGMEMVRGSATGGGYDKRTAACASAAQRFAGARENIGYARDPSARDFWSAIFRDAGPTWDSALRSAGFTVLQAV